MWNQTLALMMVSIVVTALTVIGVQAEAKQRETARQARHRAPAQGGIGLSSLLLCHVPLVTAQHEGVRGPYESRYPLMPGGVIWPPPLQRHFEYGVTRDWTVDLMGPWS